MAKLRPPIRVVAAPPPPPPLIERPQGVAALLARPEVPLPPKRKTELPPPLSLPRPVGLAGRIPPLPKRYIGKGPRPRR